MKWKLSIAREVDDEPIFQMGNWGIEMSFPQAAKNGQPQNQEKMPEEQVAVVYVWLPKWPWPTGVMLVHLQPVLHFALWQVQLMEVWNSIWSWQHLYLPLSNPWDQHEEWFFYSGLLGLRKVSEVETTQNVFQ